MEIKKSKEYARIGRALINSEASLAYIKDAGVKIAYLTSDEEKTKNRKKVYADCTKVNARYSWTCPYDFMITVYAQNIIGFTPEQMEILIKHELHHVGIDDEGVETSYYVVPHDVEEFNDIIARHGLYWDRVEEGE